jgi:hypothetical protein
MEHASLGVIVLIIIWVGPLFFYVNRIKKGYSYSLKKIRGILEIEKAIGRSTEEGKSICFSTGMTDVSPLLYACLGILSYIAEKVAQVSSRIVVPIRDPESLALVETTCRKLTRVRTSYLSMIQIKLDFYLLTS